MLNVASMPFYANSASLAVTGTLETKSPTIKAAPTKETYEAFVEPISILITEGNDSACVMTADKSEAKSSDNENNELMCSFDITVPEQIKKKVVKQELTVSGIINEIGDIELPVSSTFYSGSAKTPVDIAVQNITIKTTLPEPLNVVSVSTRTKENTIEGKVIEINSPNSSNSVYATVNTEDKDYNRKVVLDEYGSCSIAAGKTTGCTISLADHAFGSEDDRLGEVVIPMRADSENDYFSTSGQAIEDSLTIKWDSRLPVHEALLMGGLDGEDSYSVSDTESIKAEPGTMIEIIKTPHMNREDDWWHVNAKVKLVPTSSYENAPSIMIRGIDYRYLWQSNLVAYSTTFTSKDGIYENGVVKLPFDISGIIDAEYTAEITIADKLQNTITETKTIQIDNIGSEFLFFVRGRHQESTTTSNAAYFPSDIHFALWTRYRDLTLKSVTVGGKAVETNDESGQGVHYSLKAFPDGIDGVTEVVVIAEDKYGNEYKNTATFDMQPMKFTLQNDTAYDDIQEYSVTLTQADLASSSNKCSFYTTQEEAKSARYNYSGELHCSIEWDNLGDEMVGKGQGSRYNLTGFTDEPNKVLKGRVHIFNSYGESTVTADKTIQLTSLEVPPIELSISNGTVITGDEQQAFAVPINGGKVAEIRADMINADGGIVASNPFGDDVIYEQAQLGTSTVYQPRSYFSVLTESGTLWDKKDLIVKAGYDRNTKHDITEKITMVYVPNNYVTTYFDSTVDTALNSENYKLKVGMGVYDRSTKEYFYDPLTDGRWSLQLQEYQDDRTYKNIGEPIESNDQGVGIFDIDTSELKGAEIYRYRVVATIISGYKGYTKTIESRKFTLRMNKGLPIEFELEAKKNYFTTPYQLTTSMRFNDRADTRAWEKSEWYVKDLNKGDWVKVPEEGRILRYTFEEPGHYKIRSDAYNIYTGVIATVETEMLLGYEEAKYELDYNRNEFVGVENVVKVVPENSNAKLDIKWSIDGCTTFDKTENELEYRFTINEPTSVKLCVLVANKGTEQAEDRRWTKTQKSVKIREIEPIRLSSNTKKTGEVGYESILEGQIRLNSETRHTIDASWHTPTGEKIESTLTKRNGTTYDLVARYTLTDADLEANSNKTKKFFLSGELIGVHGTHARTDSVMNVLKYKFPEWNINISNDYLYAPTYATAYVTMIDRPDVKMDYTFEWLERPNSTLISERPYDDKTRGYFSVDKAGLNEYALIIRDERGNERVITAEALTEKPMDSELSFKVTTSNKLMRYPLDIVVRPYVAYDHRKDRVESSKWYINGVEIAKDDEGSTALSYTFEKDGTYNVKFTSISILGREDEHQETITVIKNKFPTCEIETRERYSSVQFTADCDDEDGRVMDYKYEFPTLDIEAYSKSYILTHEKAGESGIIPVKLIATDDSGDSTETLTSYEYSNPNKQ